MCLGVPGGVVRWLERSEPFGRAEIEFDGVRRVCQTHGLLRHGIEAELERAVVKRRTDPVLIERMLGGAQPVDEPSGAPLPRIC